MKKKKFSQETLAEYVAKAIRKVEFENGQCDSETTYKGYMPAAKAAIVAYHAFIRRETA